MALGSMVSDDDSSLGKVRAGRQKGARYALVILAVVNLLNFADRYVVSSIKELLIRDLHLTDEESALPMTGMAVVYMIFSFLGGCAVDRDFLDRRVVLSIGISIWSVATALAATSQNLVQLVFWRSLVGVGEAAFGVTAQPLIADFFPIHERTMAFAFFNLSMPVGGAIGYGLGAVLGSSIGWRAAFCVVGLPGLITSILVLFMKKPVRGANDMDSIASQEQSRGLLAVLKSRHWVVATTGLVLTVFCIGGLADWVQSFLQRYKGVALGQAGLAVGAVTALAGIVGNLLGAKATVLAAQHFSNAGFLVPSLFMIPAAILCLLCLDLPIPAGATYGVLLAAETCLWVHTSPMANISVTSIRVELRAQASGLQIFLTHVLGDVISPPIIGVISDKSHSLRSAMQITWVALFLASIVWMLGYCCLPPLVSPHGHTHDDHKSGTRENQRAVTMCSIFCRVDEEISIDGASTDEESGSIASEASNESRSSSSAAAAHPDPGVAA
mmetsp:Transcript_70934/g.148385  ORF Transcript_70934/g.148385 Transcript_70934/m.148385 type:complete len:499 (-) Transcript_70934:602-2098(-)